MTRPVLFTVADAMSTAGLEALALGRPPLVYLGSFPPWLKEARIGGHPQIPVARTFADFVDPGTADYAERICASITRHLDGITEVRVAASLHADSSGRAG